MNPAARSQLCTAMARLADGDRAAFDEVYRLLSPLVRQFCERLLGSGADADDATQQSLLTLFSRASSFDPARDALSWALSISAWQCRTVRRKTSRARETELTDAHRESIARGEPDPETQAMVHELERAASEVMGTLSALDRETILSDLLDARPDVSATSFRKRKERAFARLRDAWRRVHGP